MAEDIKLSGTTGGNTNPKGTNIAYVDVEEIFPYVEFDRRINPKIETDIDLIKQTILDKGYMYDTGQNSGVVFSMYVDSRGNIMMGEGNNRLRALYEVAQETGQKIYIPINLTPVLLDNVAEATKITDSYKVRNELNKLFKEFEEISGLQKGDTANWIITTGNKEGRIADTARSYLTPGNNGLPQSSISRFLNAIGINAITYEELPDNNIYKTGLNTFTDTPTNVVDNLITKNDLEKSIRDIAKEVEQSYKKGQTHSIFIQNLLDDLEKKGFDINNPENIKRLDNFALTNEFLNFQDLIDSDEIAPVSSIPVAAKGQEGLLETYSLSKLDDNLQIIDTPTNVVDEGIELYHSTPSGNTPKNKIHFGNYNAALDRSSLQYGTSNMMNFITPEVINNATIEIESVLRSKLPDYMYVTEDSDEFINSGVDDFDEWFEETYGDTKKNLFEQEYQDLNGTTVDLRGSDVPLSMQNQSYNYYVIYEYSENSVGDITISISIAENQAIDENQLALFSIDVEKGNYIGEDLLKENMPVEQLDNLKKINIVDDKDVEKLKNISLSVRENIVNQIQPQISKEIYENPGSLVSVIPNTEGYKFNTGYDLYKVNIKPNANILNISEPVIFNIEQADGTIKSIEMSPDIFVQTYEQSKSGMVNKFPSNIKEFVIDGKTINAEEFRANKGVLKAQILTTYIDDFDIIKYTNEVEGMITNPDGTVTFTDSYYAINDNAIEIDKVDNATNTKFNKESVEKVLQTGDYFTENTVQNINSPYYTTEELVNIVKTKDTPGGSLGAAKLNDPLVFDSWVDNLGRTTTSFVDNLPLETVVKNRVKNLIATKTKQLAKPGSLVVKAVDAWEFGVIGLMAAGIAFNEIDEVPTIINNTAINMFNSMTAPYGIAPVEKEEYDIDYEFINTVLNTGSKVMPTDIIIEKLKPYSLEEGEDVILPGTGVTATTGAKQQFEPYGEELAKRAEKTVNMKRDEVKQKILESKGVQEEKMFEQAKPKKSKATGGAGAKIL